MTLIWVVLCFIAVLNLFGIYEAWRIIKSQAAEIDFWQAEAAKAKGDLAKMAKHDNRNVILT